MISITKTYAYDSAIIGSLAMEENKLKFRFKKPVHKDKLFDIFGNAQMRVTEWKDEMIVAGEILYFAYMAG